MAYDIAGMGESPNRTRFLQMLAEPGLTSDFPEQYEKHWQNQGASGTAQILTFHILEHSCELTFSLFFSGDEVAQTGIMVKYGDEALLNELRKGDVLNYNQTKRIDPIAFLKETFLDSQPATGDEAAPESAGTISFPLMIDDDAEPQVFRAVQQLTGKTEFDLRAIWSELVATNARRSSHEQVSPIIATWLKKERDRIDLDYLRFAKLLHAREQDVTHFSAPGHACVVVRRTMRGGEIREKIDSSDPAWWGGTFYARNAVGRLVAVPHDSKDRLAALRNFENSLEYPVEEIFVDNRQIYAVIFIGKEALVWRTRHQAAPTLTGAMPRVKAATHALRSHPLLDVKPQAPQPVSDEPAPPPPAVHPFVLAKAQKVYIDSLAARSPALKEARREFMRVLFESDPNLYATRPNEFRRDILEAAGKALKRDLAGLQKESTLIDAHITIFYAERE